MSYIVREGDCSNCHTSIRLEIIDAALDSNRFYWGKTICCPICSLREVDMMVVE